MNTPDIAIETEGTGPDLVLVHGWGLNLAVWEPILPRLVSAFRVHRVDLPGHGHSLPPAGAGLEPWAEAVADAVHARLTGPAAWVGWSLGGMLAMRVAGLRPQSVAALVCIAAAPRFAAAPDWGAGMAPGVLQGFAQALEQDFAGTLARFLALQTRGSEAGRETLRLLREAVRVRGEPDLGSLREGLRILASADLRPVLATVTAPVLLLGGERDTLTAPEALRHAAECLPGARLELVGGAGHAPFLSHPTETLASLQAFLTYAAASDPA